MSQGTTEH
ncbi:hypothetical protein E2C01_062041 [Portunus trituberculatus]|uniref:Uncharacterized protein n=1 Tax=Portunus trituberculatus TaxID=210409 RepID=A0A5B7HE14_PORTR|nr:hypothetical protein [Portunus trituberculatus]